MTGAVIGTQKKRHKQIIYVEIKLARLQMSTKMITGSVRKIVYKNKTVD